MAITATPFFLPPGTLATKGKITLMNMNLIGAAGNGNAKDYVFQTVNYGLYFKPNGDVGTPYEIMGYLGDMRGKTLTWYYSAYHQYLWSGDRIGVVARIYDINGTLKTTTSLGTVSLSTSSTTTTGTFEKTNLFSSYSNYDDNCFVLITFYVYGSSLWTSGYPINTFTCYSNNGCIIQ